MTQTRRLDSNKDIKSGIYVLDTILTDGTKVVKLGYADDIEAKFRKSENKASFIYYTSDRMAAKRMVASFTEHYEHSAYIPLWYPQKYKEIISIRLNIFEEELLQKYNKRRK